MIDDKDWDWAIVILFALLIVVGLAVIRYGLSKRRLNRIGRRSLYRNPARVGDKLVAIGSIGALASAFGLIVALLRALQP